jgi:6-phosphogluconolactonase
MYNHRIGEINNVKDLNELGKKAAALIILEMNKAIQEKGRFNFALSGGATPLNVFNHLSSDESSDKIDWTNVHLFWVDERCVPTNSDQSNYGIAIEYFHSKMGVKNIHRIRGDTINNDEAAKGYEAVITTELSGDCGDVPAFDLALLGIGEDGHVASIFPDSDALHEKIRYVVCDGGIYSGLERITVTLPVLNASKRIIIIASGNKKRNIMRELIKGEGSEYPISFIDFLATNATWIIC